MKGKAQRVERLEAAAQASSGEVLIFAQDWHNPSVYHKRNAAGELEDFTREAVDQLSAAGHTCILINYVSDWREETEPRVS